MSKKDKHAKFTKNELHSLNYFLAFAKLHLENNKPHMMLAPLQAAIDVCQQAIDREG